MQRVDSSLSGTTPLTTSGTALREPLREHLGHGTDEAQAQRIWHGIERRLDGEPRALAARSGLAFAAALVVIAAVAGAIAWPYMAPRSIASLANRVSDLWYGPRPLERTGGGAFESLDADAPGPRRAELSDGSAIEVDPGARVEMLASSASQFSLVVRRGRARFSVTPGGPRRWSIEARGVAVEVVGTILSVESSPRGVSVSVDVGAVIVRSAAFADGVKRLSAGEAVFVATETENAARRANESAPIAPERAAPGDLPEAPASTQSTPAPASPARSQQARVPPSGSARAESVRDLWSRADAARGAGDARAAGKLLERIVAQHPGDARAPLAAFTLGTLLANDLGEPARAAVAFRRALALGLPEALRDSAYLNLASAWRNAGDRAAVRAVASEYAKAHPDGEQRQALDALAREPESPKP
jgi:transmembrane sensor